MSTYCIRPYGHGHGPLEKDAGPDQEVIVPFGVADGADLPRE